ncbi:MAG: histidine kinase N-terminal 7TM domain-containing protein [Methanobacterium sp.]
MTEIDGIYAIFLLISTIITLYLSFYSWNKRSNPDALYFSFLMLAVSIWTITGSLEMASISISTKILWSQISYLGIVFVGPLWLLFTLSYTDNEKWIKLKFIGPLMVIPVVILFLVATNGWFGLIWPTITPSSSQPGALLIYGHGIGFYIYAIYTYILIFLGILLLIKFLIQSPKVYQKQVFMVLIAALIPFLANAIYIAQISPVKGLDITPFAFTLTGILVAWSIFKFKMLDIIPVAYNNLFDKMSSGALVIDSLKRIVDINKAAEIILGINQSFIGSYIENDLDQLKDIYPLENIKSKIKTEIKIDSPSATWLDLQITPLDKKDQLLGWLITFIDISARKKAESLLTKSEKDYRDLVNHSLVGIYKTDRNGELLFANNSLANIFGYNSAEDIKGIMITSLYKNLNDRDIILKKLEEKGKLEEYEVEMVTRTGKPVDVLISAKRDGETISGMIMDITENKKSQDLVKKSLLEKEMLLKEIHHRVKNNLMVISSLLSLQSRYIKDEVSKSIFKESQNRARSMALIHELLYRSTDLKRINFGDYIKTLTNELFRMYVTDPDRIKLNINVEDVMLDINTAIPLGLIVNELVSNSMKHAFPNDRKGKIDIEFKLEDGIYSMIVSDNGVGFPKDYDLEVSDSLGLRIVNSLTEQIDGQIELERTNGTRYIIKFKEEIYNE